MKGYWGKGICPYSQLGRQTLPFDGDIWRSTLTSRLSQTKLITTSNMIQLICIIYKDFLPTEKRNNRTFSGEDVLGKYRYREFAETQLHCCFVPPRAVGKTELVGWHPPAYQDPSNRAFTEPLMCLQGPRSPGHQPSCLPFLACS